MMKRIVVLALFTNLAHAAAQKPSSSELEATRRALEDAQKALDAAYEAVKKEQDKCRDQQPHEIYDELGKIGHEINQNSYQLSYRAWANNEIESRKAWDSAQWLLERNNIHLKFLGGMESPWQTFGESEHKRLNDIMDKTTGTIWKINKELGDCMSTYLSDYTNNFKK